MNHDAAEDLWNKVQLRNKIMGIAEEIAPLYKVLHSSATGRSSRFISVKNVEFEHNQVGETIQYDTTIELLSDQDQWFQDIIIRIFQSDMDYNRELDLFGQLESRCLLYPNIEVVDMIYTDPENRIVVYDGPVGQHMDDLLIPIELKNFQLGVLAPIVQGVELREIDTSDTRELCQYLINVLPFEDEQKQEIMTIVDHHLQLASESKGGYQPVTIFDLKLFFFELNLPREKLNKSSILDGSAITARILLTQPQGDCYDRMSDLATIYAWSAFKEYSQSQSVGNTVGEILNFLEGFETFFSDLQGSPFETMYPRGLSLDLQMLLGYWILTFNDHISGRDSQTSFKLLEPYTYFLLLAEPFKMFETRSISPKS